MELTAHRVVVTIKDQFAVTEVSQEFKNPTGRRLEATFLFPVPKGAQLRKFTMEIDGKPAEPELLAAEKARSVYEEIVRRQRDPALLEFVDRDLYKIRIFPIEPHATRKISLSYEQLLTSDAGLVRFLYPMSADKFSVRPIDKVRLAIDLQTTRPLKTIYSPTHDVEVKREGEKRARVGYESTGADEEHDFELYFSREEEGVGLSLLTYRANDNEDGYFMLLASPGLVQESGKVLPKDVVFVIDTSGSMAGGKLDQAKKALVFCVDNLNDGDRFDIVRFSTDVEPLFKKLTPADDSHRARAREFIKRMKPLGGTAINDALKQALALPGIVHAAADEKTSVRHTRKGEDGARPQVIVFLTDGLPTVGETHIDRIVANATESGVRNTRIFCFGVGTDVNTHLLDRITEATRAASQYVLPNEDLEVKLSSFFSKIKDPVLTQPELAFPEKAETSRVYPSPLPDIFSGEQLVIVGRYAKQANGAVQLRGQAAGNEKLFAEDVAFPKLATEFDFIPRLWATRRIGWLLDEIRLRGENKELKDEVTALAREHGIVTPYTAWLIADDEERRGVRPDLRTLRETSNNKSALEYSRDNFRNLSRAQSGIDATLSSRYGAQVRNAQRAAPAAVAPDAGNQDERFLARYGMALSTTHPSAVANPKPGQIRRTAGDDLVTPAELGRETRTVAGKTFYLNGDEWVDSAVQTKIELAPTKVEFGSADYFALLKGDPAIGKWLSLGPQIRFLYQGAIYQITNERR